MLDKPQTLKEKPVLIDPEIAHIQAAIDDYRSGGKTVPHAEVMKQMYAIIEEAKLKSKQA